MSVRTEELQTTPTPYERVGMLFQQAEQLGNDESRRQISLSDGTLIKLNRGYPHRAGEKPAFEAKVLIPGTVRPYDFYAGVDLSPSGLNYALGPQHPELIVNGVPADPRPGTEFSERVGDLYRGLEFDGSEFGDSARTNLAEPMAGWLAEMVERGSIVPFPEITITWRNSLPSQSPDIASTAI